MPDAVLEIEGLTAGYDEAAVIRGIDLTVAAGRGRRAARRQRRGQDDDPARRLRARQADGRPHRVRWRPTSCARRRAAVRDSASRTCRRAAASSSG